MNKNTLQVLLADDEEGIRFVLADLLSQMDCRVWEARDGNEAMRLVREGPPEDDTAPGFDLAILDVKMPGHSGMEVLEAALDKQPELIVLMVTAFGSPELAREAIGKGAYDYFTKPFDIDDLRQTIRRALEKKRLLNEIGALRSRVGERDRYHDIIGSGEAMRRVFDLIERVVDNDVPVLITGESGTGKELVAEAIHQRGPRSANKMVRINAAAIPDQLLESELFGHEKGSFTGAVSLHRGSFEQAAGGTLFLDEIGDMPAALQAKILRAVQEGEFLRVGGSKPVVSDARLITATNRDLGREVAEGRFREDLYFRINVITIELPALRRRPEDIPLLAEHFIRRYRERLGRDVLGLAPEVHELFLRYRWPGNIRELENVIQRAIILARGPQIQCSDLPPGLLEKNEAEGREPGATGGGPVAVDLSVPMPAAVERAVEEIERRWIAAALKSCDGRQETADRLGISRKSLHNKMLKYEMY